MKIPEIPNFNWKETAHFPNVLLLSYYTGSSDILFDLIKKANHNYDYWDKVKYYDLPENIKPDAFWGIVKSVRESMDYKKVFFTNNENLPAEKALKVMFKFLLTSSIMQMCSMIDRLSSKYLFNSEEEREYLANSLMEEGIASSQLEGAAVTREIAKEMLRSKTLPKDKNEQMILNNYKAMEYIEQHCKDDLSLEKIKNIHRIITEKTLKNPEMAGVFRTAGDDINIVDDRDNTVLFSPPGVENIEEMLKALCDYANSEDENFTHPAIKASIIHFWLAYVHPFVDGNGRTARALFYWYMLKNEYSNFKYLVISKILKDKPAQYAKAFLYTEIDENDLTYFIKFNLNAVIEAINGFNAYAQKKQKENLKTSEYINNNMELSFRQRSIMKEFIKENRARDLEYFKNMLNVVYETARTDLDFLVRKGFLSKKKSGKKYLYSLSKSSNMMISENQKKYGNF